MASQHRRASWKIAAACLIGTCLVQPAWAEKPQEQQAWENYPLRAEAPAEAPNVLLVMTDDVGFGAASSFGGLIATPTFDAIGERGLLFNSFHTTAMCSPSRAALLTGRNHHAVGYGAIANLSRDEPGYTSVIPDSASTVADVLRSNGYVTAFLGKNHNTPEWESGSMGPFDHWPTGLGFDYFYGFNQAWADQWAPELVENTTQIEPPDDPEYILDKDLSNRAIEWLRRRENSAPDAPFFIYLAPGSPHTPHHAPADWIARYKGQFDMGWDKAREAIFARQKELGVIPQDAVLTERPDELPAWDSLDEDAQRVAARMMEVYAAQLSHTDYQIGRIIDELKSSGELDNTLVIFVQGDNGGDLSSFNGETNEWAGFLGEEPSYHDMLPDIDKLGSSYAWGGYPSAWAWATNTPFQWGKAVAGYLGGIRSGAVMSWPKGIDRQGTVVQRFAHLIDIAPTIYDAAGIVPPESFEGVEQLPIDGQSLAGEFGEKAAEPAPRSQYFEMLGNLGYYEDGWFAVTKMSRAPWDRTSERTPIPDNVEDYDWELYNLRSDYSQSTDRAHQNTEKLQEMVAGFAAAAERNNVFPVENDVMILLRPDQRPHAIGERDEYVYSRERTRYVAADIPPLGGHWKLTAQILVDRPDASGPVFTQGGRFTGWGLLLRDGKPYFVSRPSFDETKFSDVSANRRLEAGRHEVTVEIVPDEALGRFGARASFTIDGEDTGGGPVADYRTIANSAYLGRYGLTPLIEDKTMPSTCECTVEEVRLALPDSDGTIEDD